MARFDISQFNKSKGKKSKSSKEPMKSVSGGLGPKGLSGLKSASSRPSMSRGQSTKAADRLASMGFGKGIRMGS